MVRYSGTVIGPDGLGLPGVSVVEKANPINGVSTDIDGNWTLTVPNGNSVLQFTSIGMKAVELPAKNAGKITMQSDAQMLDDVVVVGYGVTKKKAFTGAATTIGKDDVVKKAEVNPIKALESTVPGLQMNTKTGQPGAPSTLYIRGRSSINSGTQPLYVIDGIPMESGSYGMRKNEGASTTPLAGLNSADIETITVLKDATATSIYGARAANGVIVITTKSAKQGGKTSITYSGKTGWEELPSFTDDYKHVGSAKYIEMMSEGMVNSGWFGDITKEQAKDKFFKEKFYDLTAFDMGITEKNMADVDWMKEITRSGLIHEHNISVSAAGAGEKAPRVYLSLGYLSNDAFIKGKDFEKVSLRLNASQKPNKWFQYGINTSLAYTKTNMGAGGGYFSDPITQAYMQAPITPVKDAKGNWNFKTVNGYNPVAQRSEYGDKSTAHNYRGIISPFVLFNILPELTLKSTAGVDFMYLDEFGYWSFLQPQGKDMRGNGENGSSRQTVFTVNNVLNYVKTFNEDHNLNLMLGQEIQKTHLYKTYLSGANYPVPDKNNVALAAKPSKASTEEFDLRLASFFSNIQYDYKSKYFLSASFRYDGSSRFGENNKWAPFYSFGAKYRISEDITNRPDWLNDLMVRSSYGTSGNQQVGGSWYAASPLYGYGWNYNANGGSSREQVGNPDLKWEQVQKFNAGIDARFLDGRIDFTFDYYVHNTTDMVFFMPLSRTTGMAEVPKNIGEMSNKGIEISLGTDIIRNDNLRWNVKLVASHNKNEVKKLSTDFPIEGTFTIVEPGRDYFSFKMKEFKGVNPENGKPLYYLKETGNETTEDYNAAAKRYMGSASPKWQGSIGTSLDAYGFDFSFQMSYALGGKIYGSNLRYDEQTGNSYNNGVSEYVYKNRWQKKGDITDVPRFAWGSKDGKHSSRFLMDGDYLKLQNIVLGYTLPENITSKIKLNKVRVYVTASNLYTFTAKNYRGFDPSGVAVNGVQWWNYPQPRKFLFGINVNF